MEKICRRCGKPVVLNNDLYDVFEGMHWLCFHLEYEHGDYDPDEACDDPSCPWNRILGNDKTIIQNHSCDLSIKSYENKSIMYFKVLEKEYVRYPSINFSINTIDEYYGMIEKNVWFEIEELNAFIDESLKLLNNQIDSSHLASMSPSDLNLSIVKIDNLGHYLLKYKFQNHRYVDSKLIEYDASSGFGIEYQSLYNLVSFIRRCIIKTD